jgi:succinate dehydrogenase / fumarate reductase membrane anchor subunit
MSVRTKEKPKSNFEFYSWFFMRISGLLLLVLALGHFGIMHLYFGVEKVNFDLVAIRWRSPLWRLWDLAMLILALTHGLNGIRIISDDYIRSPKWRVITMSVLYTTAFIFMVVGAEVILTFGR